MEIDRLVQLINWILASKKLINLIIKNLFNDLKADLYYWYASPQNCSCHLNIHCLPSRNLLVLSYFYLDYF